MTALYLNLLLILGIVCVTLVIISFFKIRENKDECNFIYWWAVPLGAFVWEDLLVFGLLHAVLALLGYALGNPTFWLICFLIFWIIRSLGETLYFFLEQFIVPQHHPHMITNHFTALRKIFGNISDQKCFIIMQVTMQIITVTSVISLLLVLQVIRW